MAKRRQRVGKIPIARELPDSMRNKRRKRHLHTIYLSKKGAQAQVFREGSNSCMRSFTFFRPGGGQNRPKWIREGNAATCGGRRCTKETEEGKTAYAGSMSVKKKRASRLPWVKQRGRPVHSGKELIKLA